MFLYSYTVLKFVLFLKDVNGVEANEPSYEIFYEEQEIETDEEIEETIEKEVTKDVIKEVKIPQAKALYPFTGSGISINKDEVNSSFS